MSQDALPSLSCSGSLKCPFFLCFHSNLCTLISYLNWTFRIENKICCSCQFGLMDRALAFGLKGLGLDFSQAHAPGLQA